MLDSLQARGQRRMNLIIDTSYIPHNDNVRLLEGVTHSLLGENEEEKSHVERFFQATAEVCSPAGHFFICISRRYLLKYSFTVKYPNYEFRSPLIYPFCPRIEINYPLAQTLRHLPTGLSSMWS